MTDGPEKTEPSASNDSSNSRTDDISAPKSVLPDEEGPGRVPTHRPTQIEVPR